MTRRWREDPVAFVVESFRCDPEGRPVVVDEPQTRILEAIADGDKVVVRSAHGIGKTTAAAWATLWWLATRSPSLVVTTAGTWAHLEDKLWPEIKTWGRNWRLHEAFEWQELGIYSNASPDSWRAEASSSDKAVNIEGWHSPNLLLVIDEAKSMADDIRVAITGALTQVSSDGQRPKQLILSTPPLAKVGWYADLFGSKGADWKAIHISGLDSARVSREWIEDMRQDFGEESPVYQSKVLGEIPEGAATAVIQGRWIEQAQARKEVPEDRRPVVVTCDVAREGEDLTVVGAIQKCKFRIREWAAKNDTMETAGRCLRVVKALGATYLVIDDSVTGDVPVVIRRHGRWVDIVPICTLHRNKQRVYSKHAGLEILSATGWTKIVHAVRHKVKKRLFDVVTSDGRTRVTEDHSLMVGGVETKPTDLVPGVVIDTAGPGHGLSEGGLSTEMAWALGLFLAEGSITHNRAAQNTLARIANADTALLERARRTLGEAFSERCTIGHGHSGTATRPVFNLRLGNAATDFVARVCYSEHLEHSWDREKGASAKRLMRYKKVPIQVLNGTSEIKEAFLDGYMCGDGFRNHNTWKSDSKDLTLVAGLQYLYRALGWETRVSVRDDKPNITVLRRVTHGRGVNGEVRRVRPLGVTDAYVYDLETESHTFVAGVGLLVHHNTGVGGGVTDRLREQQREGTFPKSCRIVAVIFGATAYRDGDGAAGFHSRKDELWWATRDALKNGPLALQTDEELEALALPRGSNLKAQLLAPIYEEDSRSRVRVLDKRTDNREKTRALPSKSPDLGHALILGVETWAKSRQMAEVEPFADTTVELVRREMRDQLNKEKQLREGGGQPLQRRQAVFRRARR